MKTSAQRERYKRWKRRKRLREFEARNIENHKRKQHYTTEVLAQHALENTTCRDNQPLTIYRCPICNLWLVGHVSYLAKEFEQ